MTFSRELERVRADCERHGEVSSDFWIYTWLLESINGPIFAREASLMRGANVFER